MAMTLRTDAEVDDVLARLAEHYGVSKQQAALIAIKERGREIFGLAEVEQLGTQALVEWGPVFDALADS